jgi:cell division protein FtsB
MASFLTSEGLDLTRVAVVNKIIYGQGRERSDRPVASLILTAFVCWLLLVLMVFFGTEFVGVRQRYRRLRQRLCELQREVGQHHYRNRHLRCELKALSEDPFYVERVLREDYRISSVGWVRVEVAPERRRRRR